MVEKILLDILDNAHDGIMVVLPGHVPVYANKCICEMTGYSKEDLFQLKHLALIHPDERKKVQMIFDRRLECGKAENNYETMLVTKNRRSIPVEITGSRISWKGQKACLLIIRDIRTRKRREEKLNLQAQIIQDARDPILYVDTHYNLEYMNTRAEEFFGYDSSYLGKNLLRLAEIDLLGKNLDDILKIIDKDGVWKGEILQKTKDGIWRNLFETAYLIKDEQGRPKGYSLIVQDITRNRRLGQKLEEGNIYLSYNQTFEDLLSIIHNLESTHSIVLLTRGRPVVPPDTEVISLNESLLTGDKLVQRFTETIRKKRDCIVLMNKLEYIYLRTNFEKMMEIVYKLNDTLKKEKCILVLHVLKSFFSEKEFLALRDECLNLPLDLERKHEISGKERELLRTIARRNDSYKDTSITSLSSEMEISRVTLGKWINDLEKRGYLESKVEGNKRSIYATEQGRSLQ